MDSFGVADGYKITDGSITYANQEYQVTNQVDGYDYCRGLTFLKGKTVTALFFAKTASTIPIRPSECLGVLDLATGQRIYPGSRIE